MQSNKSWHNVGLRIRRLRKTHGLSLKQLALGCDLSTNAIGLIERGEVAPTVSTLCKIASALGASASSFLQEVCPGDVTLVRAQAGQEYLQFLECAGDLAGEEAGHSLPRSISRSDEAGSAGIRQYSLCLSGQIEFEDSENQSHLLQAGDRLICNSDAFQRWHNPSTETAIVIMVFSGDHKSTSI